MDRLEVGWGMVLDDKLEEEEVECMIALDDDTLELVLPLQLLLV